MKHICFGFDLQLLLLFKLFIVWQGGSAGKDLMIPYNAVALKAREPMTGLPFRP